MAWRSRKGAATESNRDHGGCFQGPHFTALALVDASPQGERGAALARAWSEVLVRTGMDCGVQARPESVNAALKQQHSTLRTKFIGHTASYALVVLNAAGRGWAVVCGDCRVGYATDAGNDWFTPVHTLANWASQEFLPVHAGGPDRHCLTRHWNAKRFAPPSWLEVDGGQADVLIASDGYWVEECQQANAGTGMSVQDDSSALRWQREGQGLSMDSDAANFWTLDCEQT